MRHREAARAARAVAGRPDHLAEEGAAAEDAVGRHLGLVDGAVIEVQVERRARRHALADRGEAGREHGRERVGVVAILVGVGAALGLARAARLPGARGARPSWRRRRRADRGTPRSKRIASGSRRADVERVREREEVHCARCLTRQQDRRGWPGTARRRAAAASCGRRGEPRPVGAAAEAAGDRLVGRAGDAQVEVIVVRRGCRRAGAARSRRTRRAPDPRRGRGRTR